jgi:hypothetical protein
VKKILLFLAFLLNVLVAPAQSIKQKHLPSIVINSFQLKFPKATDDLWELEKGFYKVEFNLDGTTHEAWLDYMGRVERQKHEIALEQLPPAVKISLQKMFNGYRADNVERFEEGKTVYYKMRLLKPGEKRKVLFDPQGKLLDRNSN